MVTMKQVDRGSDNSYGKLPVVVDSMLPNVFDFQRAPYKETPGVIWIVDVMCEDHIQCQSLTIEIDDGEDESLDAAQVANKMFDHLMYSKLVNTSGNNAMIVNGYTMRVYVAKAEKTAGDKQSGKTKTSQEMANDCVRVIGSMIGSVLFCLRDMILCMMQSEQSLLYKRYQNKYHVNMFVGAYKMNFVTRELD